MSELLDDAIVAVKRLPPAVQDAVAAMMIEAAETADPAFAGAAIDPDDVAAVAEGFAQVQRGEYASDGDVEAAFRRFGA